MRGQIGMKPARTILAALAASFALAGCSSLFGGPKHAAPVPTVNMDVYPTNYRSQVARLLAGLLTNRADFQGAFISPPVLKPVADSPNLHYVVCVQLNGRNVERTKVVIYLGGLPTQFIDATPQQCGDAAYQPFTELQRAMPAK
jgi:hypothetical protein